MSCVFTGEWKIDFGGYNGRIEDFAWADYSGNELPDKNIKWYGIVGSDKMQRIGLFATHIIVAKQAFMNYEQGWGWNNSGKRELQRIGMFDIVRY